MLYMGGKGRIGRELAGVILASSSSRDVYLEPFMGGGSTWKHLAPYFSTAYAGDVHEDLMLMWKAAAEGWTPPSIVNEEKYQAVRKQRSPSALRGFVGFGCSFGGKWWGGYARSAANGNDYYARHAAKSVIEIAALCPPNRPGELRHCSFREWTPAPGWVIYADPPYANTTKYKDNFNTMAFWNKMQDWVCLYGADVFVSEYAAPKGWQAIFEKQQPRKVSGGTGQMTTEKLFKYGV